MRLRPWLRAPGRQRAAEIPSTAAGPGHVGTVAEFATVTIGGHTFELAVDANAHDSYTEWIRNGCGTDAPVVWARRLVDSESEVLDLGANLGTFALALAHECRRVIAVEAMPDNAALLTASIARNALAVIPVHAAALDRTSTVAMSDRSAWARVTDSGDVVVPAVAISDLLSVYASGPLDLVKVDIEGGEPLVVPQIIEAAASQPDLVLIYESNQAVAVTDVGELHRLVAAAGYQQWYLDPNTHAAIELDLDLPQYTLNVDVLAIKGRRAADVDSSRLNAQSIVDSLVSELTSHPILLARSYAYVVATLFPDEIGQHPDLVAARSGPPQHSGAAAEVDRFASILGVDLPASDRLR